MRAVCCLIVLGLSAAVLGVSSAQAANGSVSVGIQDVAACTDVTRVLVTGSTTYSNNRLDAGIYYFNDQGQPVLLSQQYSPAFGAGPFSIQMTLPYTRSAATAGEVLRLDVQVQALSGNSYVNVGPLIMQNVVVQNASCYTRCNVVVSTRDGAPADGTITLRSHFGELFRPEGWLHGALHVLRGGRANLVFVAVPCNWAVRAWYYPKTGDPTPKLLPAQYWPSEFQATRLDLSNPYATSFAKGLKATAPLEPDDPFVAR